MTDNSTNRPSEETTSVSSECCASSSDQPADVAGVPQQTRRLDVGPSCRNRWWLRSVVHAGLFLAAGLLLIVTLGFAQRIGWISAGGSDTHTQTVAQEASREKEKVSYVCPMMCTSPQAVPGRCPVCGMELAAVKSGAKGGAQDDFSINLEPAARRLAHITTMSVESTILERSIRTVGRIAFDESRLASISAYVDGRIEELFADYTGVDVTPGDHMVVLYSPNLYAAQVEYLVSREAEKSRESRAESREQVAGDGVQKASATQLWDFRAGLFSNAREKLCELGMTDAQIADLDKQGHAETRLQICAPIGGTVIEKLCREGDYVKTGQPIYRIADLSVVWLMLELFPEDATQIRYGQKVEAIAQSLPEDVFSGRVAFIDPVVNPKTRTVGVRVEILNSERHLRPGDYATASIKVPVTRDGRTYDPELAGKWISPRYPRIVCDEPGQCPICKADLIPTSEFGYESVPAEEHETLVVPRDAVLMAGHDSVVYVETEPGRFEIRSVVLGPLTEDKAVIFGGLQQGDQVATSGNFLIDSQMQLAGNPSLIDPTRIAEQQPKTIEEPDLPVFEPLPLAVAPGPSIEEPAPMTDVSAASKDTSDQPIELTDAAGATLDQLYFAYFAIQQALAADQTPSLVNVSAIHAAAEQLADAPDLPKSLKDVLTPILDHAAQLNDVGLDQARKQFKPISHAVIRLASGVRGPETAATFIHFNCPMVEGGGGDWLQQDAELLNPYFGSQMLHCGQKVNELAAPNRLSQVPTVDTSKGTARE